MPPSRAIGPRPPQPARTAPPRTEIPEIILSERPPGRPRRAPHPRGARFGTPHPAPAGRGAQGRGKRATERRMGELVKRTGDDPTFEKAFDHVLKVEGGYVNDPDDPGGETIYGISRRAYPDVWARAEAQGRQPSQADAYVVYRDIWRDSGAADIAKLDSNAAPRLAIAVFDAAVNHGPGRAAVLLQRATGAGVRQDGSIGPKTLERVQERLKYDSAGRSLLTDLRTERTRYYHRITAKNPSLTKFYRGWMQRLTTLDDVTSGRKR